MKRLISTSIIALAVSACSSYSSEPVSSASSATEQVAETESLTTLVDQVAIPYEKFTLANGLDVIVHEDRKAPIVGVAV